MSLRDLDLDIDYTGRGEDILHRFVLPLLAQATHYDRVTSFFTTESLVAIAEGLDALWNRRGHIRLVLGLHDVPADLAQAALASSDPVAEMIEGVRARIVSGIATIVDEIALDRLATVAWMMQDGLLEICVAAPLAVTSGRQGMFHNKAFVFRDTDGNVVAAVGSPNETGAGLGANFEHLTVFSSWEQPRYTDAQVRFFESLWSDRQAGLTVRALDAGFAEEILAALPIKPRPTSMHLAARLDMHAILDLAASMPALAMVSGDHAALFPHQERAFLDALSRWPVRVLLADEVGLGKTFEAGAVLKYLLKHTAARRALVLAPKGVVHQWQAELREHFELDAWVFDSGRRAMVSPDGEARLLGRDEPVLGPSTPAVTIMSAQYARGSRRAGHALASATAMPDVLIVDEAHAARVRPDLAGTERPTLMWRLLQDIMPKVPHVVFATATPMQMHWREYHALLELLGLPEAWAKPPNYERSLRFVSEDDAPTLQDASQAAALLCSCISAMQPDQTHLEPDERGVLERLMGSQDDPVERAVVASREWQAVRRLLTKLHPAHLLTVRNTRTALEAVGYKFPTRNLIAPALDVPGDVRSFYTQVEEYLDDVYFEVERALFPDRKFNVGFVKCSYQQRLASSLEACRLSMEHRKSRVEGIAADVSELDDIESGMEELLESDVFDDEDVFEPADHRTATPVDAEEVLRAARIEIQYLDGLLTHLRRILDDSPDPKTVCALELVRRHLERGESLLVFSRYTDTLDAVVDAYRDEMQQTEFAPYGVYTGQTAVMDLGVGPQRSTRGDIRRALEQGAIRIVFCSDAASEGVNLQSARVIINVDVPWNPARLEQRIGRIARLGQKASSVDVYNLWYPDSIESKMYKRLMDRRDLYELAVGEFPEVVSAAIRAEVSSRYGEPQGSADPLAELQSLRNDVQVKALRRLWSRSSTAETLAHQFRSGLSALAQAAVVALDGRCFAKGDDIVLEIGHERVSFSVEPGDEHVISLTHPALRWFGQREVAAGCPALRVMCSEGKPVCFGIDVGGMWRPMTPDSTPAFLAELAGLASATGMLETPAVLETTLLGQLPTEWLPKPTSLRVPARLECEAPPIPAFGSAEAELAPNMLGGYGA